MPALSLRARATCWYAGLLACSLIASSVSVYFGIRAYLKHSLQRGLSSTAQTIQSDILSRLSDKGEAWVVGEIRESFEGSANDRFVRLSSADRILYQSQDMRDPSIPLNQVELSKMSGGPYFHRQRTSGGWVMVYALPYQASDGRLIQIESGASLSEMMTTLKWLGRILFAAGFLTLIAAIAGGYHLMHYPLRPLVALTVTAERIGRKDLGDRLPVSPTGDELESLAHSLNAMIERLENALAHNHRFSADASHELRTPLTIMRGEIDELLRREDLPADVADNLVSALDEVDRMSRIVNSLMAITRLDAGERMVMEKINFSELVRTTIDQMRLLADEKGLPITFSTEREVFILGDRMRVKQVVVNLIDNAIKYTPAVVADTSSEEHGLDRSLPIDVSVYTSDDQALLRVADNGTGISAEAQPFIFDRFYRADFARSRGAGGVGLGLAIVKSIVAAHDGRISVTSGIGKGTTMRAHFPLLRPEKCAGHETVNRTAPTQEQYVSDLRQ